VNKKEKLSFVIPCYRSESHLKQVIDSMILVLEKSYLNYEYEIILINDGSPDNTWSTIEGISFHHDRVIGVDLSKNFGQHAAIMAGYKIASGDIIVGMDDDGEHSINDLHILLNKLNEGFDFVCGHYIKKKNSMFRNLGTKVNNMMAGYLIGKPKDTDFSSFNVIRRFVVDEIIKYQHSYPYIAGLILRTTKNISMVEVPKHERIGGISNYNIRKLLSLWFNGFTAFSVKPLRLVTFFGFFLSITGISSSLFVIIRRLIYPNIAAGWTSLIGVMFLLFGITFIMLGLLGEYVGRIYICINNSPQYVIRKILTNNSEESINIEREF
jgi:undecaprenyl-phosphate 4-deoxy-4-formamido-L-arabinose transferase